MDPALDAARGHDRDLISSSIAAADPARTASSRRSCGRIPSLVDRRARALMVQNDPDEVRAGPADAMKRAA
jgi:hypothetical protein